MSNPNTTSARTWRSLRAPARPTIVDKEQAMIEAAYARVAATQDGQLMLAHLRFLTIEKTLPAGAPDSALRELEAQRKFVADIEQRVERGGRGKPTE